MKSAKSLTLQAASHEMVKLKDTGPLFGFIGNLRMNALGLEL